MEWLMSELTAIFDNAYITLKKKNPKDRGCSASKPVGIVMGIALIFLSNPWYYIRPNTSLRQEEQDEEKERERKLFYI